MTQDDTISIPPLNIYQAQNSQKSKVQTAYYLKDPAHCPQWGHICKTYITIFSWKSGQHLSWVATKRKENVVSKGFQHTQHNVHYFSHCLLTLLYTGQVQHEGPAWLVHWSGWRKASFLQGVVLALCWRQAAHDAIKSPSVTGSSSISNAEDLYYFVQIKAGYETEKPFCWQKWASFDKPVKQKPCETEFTHSNSIRKAQSKRYLYPKTRANLCSEHNHYEKMNQDSSHTKEKVGNRTHIKTMLKLYLHEVVEDCRTAISAMAKYILMSALFNG